MKKFFYIVLVSIVVASSFFTYQSVAFAQDPFDRGDEGYSAIAPERETSANKETAKQGVFPLRNPLKFESIGELLNNFADLAAFVLVLVAVVLIIFTGFQFVAAQGKPEELKRLGVKLGYIILGVGIVIGARLIINVVINTLEATGAVNQSTVDNARGAANPTTY